MHKISFRALISAILAVGLLVTVASAQTSSWGAPGGYSAFPGMAPRQLLHLGLDSPDGPLVIETTFARYLTGLSRDDRSRVFAVAWHEEVEAHTRAHVRVDLKRLVHLRVPESRTGGGGLPRAGRQSTCSPTGRCSEPICCAQSASRCCWSWNSPPR